MKRQFMALAIALLMLLSACQQAPSNAPVASTLPPSSMSQSGNTKHVKLDIPFKSTNYPDEQLTLRIDAQVYCDGHDSAPSYVCLPMAFGDTEAAARELFGDDYESAQRVEYRDTTGIAWPYRTALPWLEKYSLSSYKSISFEHGLGKLTSFGESGMPASYDISLDWQKPGDADGDGRANGMQRSREECQAQAERFIAALGLDMMLVRTDVLDLTEFQNYRFYYAHNYGGIPSSIGDSQSFTQGEGLIIYVCDSGIYRAHGMLYEVIETAPSQPLISAQEAIERLITAANTYPLPIEREIAEQYTIDSISLVYITQSVEGDDVDVIGDGRGGLMRNVIPAWQFSTGYFSGMWSAIELYIDARTGEYLP